MRHTLPTLTLTLFTVVAACGGTTEDGGTATTAAPIAREDFVEAAVDAYCVPLAACCEKEGFPYHRYSCEALIRMVYPATAVENATESDYDPVAAGACVDDLKRSMATCLDSHSVLPACDRVFTGRVVEGGDCGSQFACAQPPGGRAWCRSEVGNGTGKCAVIGRGVLDAACTGTCRINGTGGDVCTTTAAVGASGQTECHTSDGLQCDPASRKCAPLAPLGSACIDSLGCVAGAECVNGTCATQPTLGGPCKDDVACAEGYCDIAKRVCTVKKPDGATCYVHEECASGGCNLGSTTKVATCGPRLLATRTSCGGQ